MKQKITRILFVVIAISLTCIGLYKPPKHSCQFGRWCPFEGKRAFTTGCGFCKNGDVCWTRDSIHFSHPKWTYEECQVVVREIKGYSEPTIVNSTSKEGEYIIKTKDKYEKFNVSYSVVHDTVRILPKRKKGQ